jgi:hypothetical protein
MYSPIHPSHPIHPTPRRARKVHLSLSLSPQPERGLFCWPEPWYGMACSLGECHEKKSRKGNNKGRTRSRCMNRPGKIKTNCMHALQAACLATD